MGIDTLGEVNLERVNNNLSTKVVVKEAALMDESLGAYPKTHVTAEIQRDLKSKEVKLVFKLVGLHQADRYINNWKLLKQAGVPTIPTLRKIDSDTVAMTDFKRDGSDFFGKGKYFELDRSTDTKPLSNADNSFLRIDLEEVRDQAKKLAFKASEAGIRLPEDDTMDLLVHPDGSWSLVVLDISQLEIPGVSDQLHHDNDVEVDWFVDLLEMVREKLIVMK